MSESNEHISLVNLAFNYIKSIVPNNLNALIECDNGVSKKPSKVIGNFIPDVYYCFNNLLIIGEAKTYYDYDRPHSYAQYKSYVEECAFFNGKSVIVICVPWQHVNSAKNHFRVLKKKLNCNADVVIINEIGEMQSL